MHRRYPMSSKPIERTESFEREHLLQQAHKVDDVLGLIGRIRSRISELSRPEQTEEKAELDDTLLMVRRIGQEKDGPVPDEEIVDYASGKLDLPDLRKHLLLRFTVLPDRVDALIEQARTL